MTDSNKMIIRHVDIDSDPEWIQAVMRISAKIRLRNDPELLALYFDFMSPLIDDGECLRRMAVFVDKINNKPSTELEIK